MGKDFCHMLFFSVLAVAFLAAPLAQAEVSLTEKGGRGEIGTQNTGDISLIDAGGLEWFLNTDITFSTTSSASGAMSEATFTMAVTVTTSLGGTSTTTLNDAFDGYNTLCLIEDNVFQECATGDANIFIYNFNGPSTSVTDTVAGPPIVFDAACPNNRQVIFPDQTITKASGNDIVVSRRVFVPDNDEFARWINIFTNNGATTETVTAVIFGALGSDGSTTVENTSSGDAVADTGDEWVVTNGDFSDPRLGHVLQNAGAAVPLVGVDFANGDDTPFWGYTFDLDPGQTRAIMNFVTGQPTIADAQAQAAALTGLGGSALDCLDSAIADAIINFALGGGGNGGCSIAGASVNAGQAVAGALIPLLPAFAVGIRMMLRKRREGKK